MGNLGKSARSVGVLLQKLFGWGTQKISTLTFAQMGDSEMNIIITGSDGYVAGNLIEKLKECGNCQIYGFDPKHYTDDRYENEWETFIQDIPKDISHIIHLGAITNSTYKKANIVYSNALACIPISEYARDIGCKVIYFSSCAAIRPMTMYGWSKVFGEAIFKEHIDENNLCILRPYNIYGGDESRKDNPSSYWKISQGWDIPIYEDCTRDFIHVIDVCDITAELVHCEWKSGEYDLGTGEPIKMSDLYQLLTNKKATTQALPDNINPYIVASADKMICSFE